MTLIGKKEYFKGIGKMIMDKLQEKYSSFHQQMLTADSKAFNFYKKCGFRIVGSFPVRRG